ncbi:hypothetical protein ABW20_dc0108556 [Dactylellina cionopaga]|nr:hypothetical protein ABW20_dc0108556 [Dactylellina cionopaga]
MAPAIRALVNHEETFEAGVKTWQSTLQASSAKRNPGSSDIFSSQDSFVTPASSSNGWQFGSRPSAKLTSSQLINSLATPARRPAANGILLAATVNVDKQQKAFSRNLMSCPPKRPAFQGSPTTPISKKTAEVTVKINNLATPARRPDFSSFAQPTKSSLAKSTPTRVSPLKEPPKRAPGLSPLKSSVTMTDVKEHSSPIRDRKSASPARKPFKAEENVSPIRKSATSKNTCILTEFEEFKDGSQLMNKRPPFNSARKPSAPLSPTRNAIFPDRLTKTERKAPALPQDNAFATTVTTTATKTTSPINRKLNFAAPGHSVKKSPKKSEFDIFVDSSAAPTKDIGEDSMTTEEIFGKSLPKNLGTRRESGIFLTSPDRSVSIGPFTAKPGAKPSPLRKEYERDIKRASGVQTLGKSPSGNFFLDTMHKREAGTPNLVLKRTMIVPLKGVDEIEESDDEMMEFCPTIEEENIEGENGGGLLQNMTVFLDVRTGDGTDASASFVGELKELGATIVKRWRFNLFGKNDSDINPMGVNLVVFKDGSNQTLNRAKKISVPVVGVAWVKQ